MSLLQQLVQFLSQPPESLVYHIVTLLALQATFWLALWQLRRNPADAFARRLVWASGGIIIGRLIILIASLIIANPAEATGILPPLERAIDTATAVLLVWALVPQFRNYPRLGDVLLLIILILIGFLYAFFAQAWIDRTQTSVLLGGYAATNQAAIWEAIQLVFLGLGSALIIYSRENEWPLRLAVILALFLVHLLSLFDQYSGNLATTDISYWVRLGNLIAFPLLAILTYRHNLTSLLPSRGFGGTMVENVAHLLQLARITISDPDLDKTLDHALNMTAESVSATTWALAMFEPANQERLKLIYLTGKDPAGQVSDRSAQITYVNIGDYPAFRQALGSHEQVELLTEGQGAKQLHELYSQLDLKGQGALLVEPLYVEGNDLGLLLLVGPVGQASWSNEEKQLATPLATYLAQAIHNARRYELSEGDAMWPVLQNVPSQSGPDDRALSLEKQLADEQVKTRQLAASLLAAEEVTRDARVRQLESEIDALRESLIEAENAMALAAASDAGVSTDWVMRTVSRYSGELEEAQVHISNLEKSLVQLSSQSDLVSVAAHTREMRTPLTSLGVYTDLLLGETLGILGAQQIDVLQRIKTSIENLTTHLDQILLETSRREQSKDGRVLVDVRETIESAISSISSYMQAKRLKLDLIIDDDLPLLPTFDNDFYLIVSRLLGSACLVSAEDGHVSVKAQFDGRLGTASDLLLLSVSVSGESEGQDLIYRLLSGQSGSTNEPLPDHLIQAGDNISIVIDLVKKLGGRLWVDQEAVAGNIVSVLLPLTSTEMVP